MKKNIILLFILLFLSSAQRNVYAVTPTVATNSETKEKLDQQINQLKEKIASRVSELNLVEKRGMIGTVTEVKGNQILLTDSQGNTRYADVDELTKFTSLANKNFGLSDLTKGTQISILGNYNKQSKRILARFISAYTSPIFYSGYVSQVNAKEYQITVLTKDQKSVEIDISTSTKISSHSNASGLVRSGFTKIAAGDKVFVVGVPSKTLPNMLAASRIIIYMDAPKDTNLTNISPTIAASSPTILPTATGNKRLNPVQ